MYLSASLCWILPPPKHSQSSPTFVTLKSDLGQIEKTRFHLFFGPVIDISMVLSKSVASHKVFFFPCVFSIISKQWTLNELFHVFHTSHDTCLSSQFQSSSGQFFIRHTCRVWWGHTWTPQRQSPPPELLWNLIRSSESQIYNGHCLKSSLFI